MFANLKLRRPQIPENREFPTLEKHISRTSLNSTFRGWRVFSEFPNTSPSGKRVDSDDPIPQTFRKFSKKRHPRNVGGDTRRPETLQRSDRGRVCGTTPLVPINRWPLL
jgi:hypothetical protein